MDIIILSLFLQKILCYSKYSYCSGRLKYILYSHYFYNNPIISIIVPMSAVLFVNGIVIAVVLMSIQVNSYPKNVYY